MGAREDDEHPGWAIAHELYGYVTAWSAPMECELACDRPGFIARSEPWFYGSPSMTHEDSCRARIYLTRKAAERALHLAEYRCLGRVALVELRWTDERWEGEDGRGDPVAVLCDECEEKSPLEDCWHRNARKCPDCFVVRPKRFFAYDRDRCDACVEDRAERAAADIKEMRDEAVFWDGEP